MEESTCISCRRPKSVHECGLCHEPLCKNCAQFLDESTFSFMKKLPDELSHSYYCYPCYDAHVEPTFELYRQHMQQAQESYIFFTTQKKPVPIIKKSKEKVSVESCEDRDETILRLAFLSAEQGYNAVVQVEVTSEKIRNEGYEKSKWRGVGFPAQVDAAKLERWK